MKAPAILETNPAKFNHERAAAKEERLFAGKYPCGIVYADRYRERHGDYVRLAFLTYATLELELEKDCPPELAERIRADAKTIQAMRGQPYQIAGNMSVILGEGRCAK